MKWIWGSAALIAVYVLFFRKGSHAPAASPVDATAKVIQQVSAYAQMIQQAPQFQALPGVIYD